MLGDTRSPTTTTRQIANDSPVADNALVKNGRVDATALTMPNDEASTTDHPLAMGSNVPAPGIGVASIQIASPIQMAANHKRPPANHPNNAQTAMAGAMSTIVCSIGTTNRSAATSGTARASRSTRMTRGHPCSRSAATLAGVAAGADGVVIRALLTNRVNQTPVCPRRYGISAR